MTTNAAKDRRRTDLELQLNWVIGNPDKFEDANVREAAIDFLKGSIAELDKPDEIQKMKNTLRPGRVRLRDRLRTLIAAIVTQAASDGK